MSLRCILDGVGLRAEHHLRRDDDDEQGPRLLFGVSRWQLGGTNGHCHYCGLDHKPTSICLALDV